MIKKEFETEAVVLLNLEWMQTAENIKDRNTKQHLDIHLEFYTSFKASETRRDFVID